VHPCAVRWVAPSAYWGDDGSELWEPSEHYGDLLPRDPGRRARSPRLAHEPGGQPPDPADLTHGRHTTRPLPRLGGGSGCHRIAIQPDNPELDRVLRAFHASTAASAPSFLRGESFESFARMCIGRSLSSNTLTSAFCALLEVRRQVASPL
jgi:hypothetical protein